MIILKYLQTKKQYLQFLHIKNKIYNFIGTRFNMSKISDDKKSHLKFFIIEKSCLKFLIIKKSHLKFFTMKKKTCNFVIARFNMSKNF